MKKFYNSPSVEVTRFDAEDIILTSVTPIDPTAAADVINTELGTAEGTQVVVYDTNDGFDW